MPGTTPPTLGWAGIARLGLVQLSLGAVVVLTTSTLNRVMVVELALPALLPGLLVAWHYLVQMARPRMGHGSDVGGRRTPWIVGGMAVLAAGGVLAAVATAWMARDRTVGIALAALAFTLIGLGVAAAGTSLLVLLAKRVDAPRRAGAATLVWLMMIVGFAVTAGVAGRLLDPYSPARLVAVSAGVSTLAMIVTVLALWGVEGRRGAERAAPSAGAAAARPSFRAALAEVWAEPQARLFTIFVFVSMLAYSAQDLILEPFAGVVFGMTPGESTSLSGLQHGGVLAGMLLASLAGRQWGGHRFGSLTTWTVGGCVASAFAMASLVVSGLAGPPYPFKATVFVLGVANGAFSIAAIGSMMRLAGEGREGREGVRMGLWGAAQAIAFGFGGAAGAAASDLSRAFIASPGAAYAAVFALEGLLFIVAAVLAVAVGRTMKRLGPAASAADERQGQRQGQRHAERPQTSPRPPVGEPASLGTLPAGR
jgi:BCD family chlorophyll transporter-like MFS transporter